MKVAILEVNQETNSFCAHACDLSDFENSYLLYGKDVVHGLTGTGTEVGGFIHRLGREREMEIVPILAAHSVPSGPVLDEVIEKLANEITVGLKGVGQIDAVLVALHGAMLGTTEDDPEGYLLQQIRQVVGDIPIVGTLDLHANVSEKMVRSSTCLIGYRHYPHDDTFETGVRAAEVLLRILRREIKPVMAIAKIPMLVAPNNMQTSYGPMAKLLEEQLRIEREGEAVSVSIFPVQPWLDVPNLGFSAVVITDNNPADAHQHACRLVEMAWSMREQFEVKTVSVDEALDISSSGEGPVLLVDTADSPGGGSTGDSVEVLARLMARNIQECTVLSVVDPWAAELAASAGVGSRVSLMLGNKLDPRRGDPIQVEGIVRRISDGKFKYTGGLFEGTWGSSGLTVLLQVGEIHILIVTRATYEWDDVQYRAIGLDVREMKYTVVKMPMNYKFTYQGIANKTHVLDTSGPCAPNLLTLPYKKITHPLYPFDNSFNNSNSPVIKSYV